MKGAVATALAVSALSAGAEALQLAKRDAPRVVHFPIERRQNTKHVISDRKLKKRQTVSQTLDNFEQGSLYFANVTIGTPPQNFRFHVDTGSSDLWANHEGSRLCSFDSVAEYTGQFPCSISGTYDANSSSTYNFVSSDFVISYADGSGAQGDYVTDTLRFGDSEIPDQQFAVGYRSSSAQGVMGIGFPNLEVQAINNGQEPYSNIPIHMVEEGLIGTAAYSLWLDDLFSSTGNILFGGVDQDKYVGDLVTLPVTRVQNMLLEMEVQLNRIDLIDENGNNQTIQPDEITVLLDSGSTLSYLPVDTALSMYDAVGATFDQQAGYALCSCDLANSSMAMDFVFSGQVIEVRMQELVLPGGAGDPDGNFGCVFGIMPQEAGSSSGSSEEDSSYTLGDTFIRNAYIVYDLQNGEISLAQTNFNSESTDIREIQNSTNVGTFEGNGDPSQQSLDTDGNGENAASALGLSSFGIAWASVLALATAVAVGL